MFVTICNVSPLEAIGICSFRAHVHRLGKPFCWYL
jgi:hypothetical protein